MKKLIPTNEINKTLANGVVTPEILGYAAYSVNKRAKNWREKEREYRERRQTNRYFVDKYDNEDKAREKKEEYYDLKSEICDYFKPVKIHSLTDTWYNWKEDEFKQKTKYFLLFEFGGFSFHQPYDNIENNVTLEVQELPDNWHTEGADVATLMSMQMVNKILKGLRNSNYKLIA